MWALLLVCSACAPVASAPQPKPIAPPSLHTMPPAKPEFRGYRVADSVIREQSFRDGAPLHRGAIVDGLRVRTEGTGIAEAESVARPPLIDGVAVPAQLGGGFLFWSERGLFHAPTFLADLSPITDLGYLPGAISFGPSYLIARGKYGGRAAIDLRSGQRMAWPKPLLVDVATQPDGRTLELLENGACQLSSDFGKSFRACALPSGQHSSRLEMDGPSLLAVFGDDARLRFEPGGTETLVAKDPQAASTGTRSVWLEAQSPLELALQGGVAFGEEFAAVAAQGSIASVNLRTGELVQMTRAVVPATRDCQLLAAPDGPLLACSTENGKQIFGRLFDEHARVVGKFPAPVKLAYAEGVLIAAAHCNGVASPSAVCVRYADGAWREFDVTRRLAELTRAVADASKKTSVVRWVPKQGGGAVAIVDGSVSGLLDAESGSFRGFATPDVLAQLQLIPEAPRLESEWVAPSSGGMRGWVHTGSGDRAVAVSAEGRLEPTAYSFAHLGSAGARALAFDGDGRAFQSQDWGQSWVETLSPPRVIKSASARHPRCSEVGCNLGPWLRVGWLVEAPRGGERWHVAGNPARPLSPARPVLSCRERGPANAREHEGLEPADLRKSPSSFDVPLSWSVAHPLHDWADPAGLRGLVNVRGLLSSTVLFSYVLPFEPKGLVERIDVPKSQLLGDAGAASSEPTGARSGPDVLPVLGREPGTQDGVIVAQVMPVWLRDHTGVYPFPFGADSEGERIFSAVSTGPRSLRALSMHEGKLHVLASDSGRVRRLFDLPTLAAALYPDNPDALAVGAHGELAVLRARSGAEPASASEPLVLIDEQARITELAPWSKLYRADAPECRRAPDDYRAILQTEAAWLQVEPFTRERTDAAHLRPIGDESHEPSELGMVASIRINSARVCLEAVEIPVDEQTRVVARFVGAAGNAAAMRVDAHSSFHQDLDCTLSAPR